NIPVHHAIGTSAAIGFPIALAGTAGYITSGLVVHDLPSGSLGFIYLPALAGIAVVSILTAPLGARLAHRLPVSMLKKIFAFFLIGIGTKMLTGMF
ncbi:MAG: sulfite exporter TauE/SafE family protein, partial [Deltaproteobacteria bacterium]|nr:sulfite exporter TauE/SafE family protein [Deltaproteobacteria bacterium]